MRAWARQDTQPPQAWLHPIRASNPDTTGWAGWQAVRLQPMRVLGPERPPELELELE
jgi:hypothetical protein